MRCALQGARPIANFANPAAGKGMHAPPPDTLFSASGPGRPPQLPYMHPPPGGPGQPQYMQPAPGTAPAPLPGAPPGMMLVQTAPGAQPIWVAAPQPGQPVQGVPGPVYQIAPSSAQVPGAAAPQAAPQPQPANGVQGAIAMAQAAAAQRGLGQIATGATAGSGDVPVATGANVTPIVASGPQAGQPAAIAAMQSQAQQAAPPLRPAPAASEPQSSMLKVDFDVPDGYPLVEHVRGPGNSYLQHIESETSVTVQLRGKGSGGKHESATEPLSIWLFHPEPWKRTQAFDLAKSLLETAHQGAEAWRAAAQAAQDAAAPSAQPPPQQSRCCARWGQSGRTCECARGCGRQ